jgi:DNA-binding beta-propeller fold protein YncE
VSAVAALFGSLFGARCSSAALLCAAMTLAAACVAPSTSAAADSVEAPAFEVDPFWPKPLPNHWVLGSTIGVSVDAQDHVWIIHRPQSVDDNFKGADLSPKVGDCCKVAPPVLEFDQAGDLVGAWGGPGPGYEWPDSNHGITVDHAGNVWLGGNGDNDTQILKFTSAGKFLLQIGRHGQHHGSNDTANLWRAAKIFEDPGADEIYVADGYGNRRVIVFDAETGKYKRHWGAYGNEPDDGPLPAYDPSAPPSKQFSIVHCAIVSHDGLVYVCDRQNDRVQVFRKDGTFVREAFFDRDTLRSGSVWDMAFSRDPEQTYIYMANGVDEKIHVVLRSTLEVLTSFGDGGRQPGQFFGVHNLDTDSKGNLYATETYTGARVQRFIYKGLRPVTKRDRGVAWPEAR